MAKASPELHKILNQDGKVALHCMGGSGRTGLLAVHLLLEKGWELADIIREVQALRPGAFTKPVQVDYIEHVAG
jgi:protein-tyrosine phosphatase